MKAFIYDGKSRTQYNNPSFTSSHNTDSGKGVSSEEWIIRANSTYSSSGYPFYKIFDKNLTTSWTSDEYNHSLDVNETIGGVTTQCKKARDVDEINVIRVDFPIPLSNITFTFTNRSTNNNDSSNYTAGPIRAYFYTSDTALTLATIQQKTYDGEVPFFQKDNPNWNVPSSQFVCNLNNITPYQYLGVSFPITGKWSNHSSTSSREELRYMAIGELSISGYDRYANNWKEASIYVNDGSNWQPGSLTIS